MGMVLSLSNVSASTIEALREKPQRVWQIVAPEYPELLEEMAKVRPSLWQRLLGQTAKAPVTPAEPLVLAPDEAQVIDIDKSWHAIHFLLTQTAGETGLPEGFLMSGGAWVGDIDLGYGPGRVLSVEQTRRVNELLQAQPVDRLFERFDGRRMEEAEVYPGHWDRPAHDEDNIAYVAEYYAKLRDFVEYAAEGGFGLLIWMS